MHAASSYFLPRFSVFPTPSMLPALDPSLLAKTGLPSIKIVCSCSHLCSSSFGFTEDFPYYAVAAIAPVWCCHCQWLVVNGPHQCWVGASHTLATASSSISSLSPSPFYTLVHLIPCGNRTVTQAGIGQWPSLISTREIRTEIRARGMRNRPRSL